MSDDEWTGDQNLDGDVDGEEEQDVQQIGENLVSRQVYNDVIDEEIDQENPEQIPMQNKKIENNHIDEVVQISSDEGDDVPSPRDNEDRVFDDDPTKAFGEEKMGMDNFGEGEEAFDGYNPQDYMNLNVAQDVKQLFLLITAYVPQVTEIETILKPFIPEYIPTVGEVDAYLKIPRPDGQPESLGLYQIDEPALNQSKKSEMDYIIKEFYLANNSEIEKIHSVENAHKNPKEIVSWIQTVDSHQAKKSAPTVVYSQKMPDIDFLLEPWGTEFERFLGEIPIPMENLDTIPMDVQVKFACSILDIPIHPGTDNNMIESLHLMFTMYSGLRENQHFQQNQEELNQVNRQQL